jgi:serine/threonine protein kinase
MPGNRKILIDRLAAPVRLDNRYTDIVTVNCDPATGDKLGTPGYFSVVFKARDTATGRYVAIKFFDPEVSGPALAYRIEAFKRESALLQTVLRKGRCLQLVQPITDLSLAIPMAGGGHVTLPCSYFVTEWLDGGVSAYFDTQDKFETLAKLHVFRDATLAVFALHTNEIHHRDLKADNLMGCNERNVTVAIDLGTAAHRDSAHIIPGYFSPVGASAYSPPEAFAGLAGVRAIGPAADIYALGCLLYELFNDEFFYFSQRTSAAFNHWFMLCTTHMQRVLTAPATDEELLAEWRKVGAVGKRAVTLPRINDLGSTVPSGVASVLDDLLSSMTAVDLHDRIKGSDQVLRRIDSAIRILENALAEQARNEERKARRELLRLREAAKQARLAARFNR